MKKSKKEFDEYLNSQFTSKEVMDNTEHCWAGNDKTPDQKNRAKLLARAGNYAKCLKQFDPVAYNVAFNDWKRI